ncbi:MAG: KamA family radical SAM protein [Spirochaetes bacterium]|nr:KamA family radical SAM protein [Spirochaetota bacterium]
MSVNFFQEKKTVTSISELKKQLNWLKDTTLLEKITHKFPFKITPYYLSLINPEDPHDPLLLQVFPDIKEMDHHPSLTLDSFAEQKKWVAPGIIQRYPDRVLLVTTNHCFAHCRYCTRKWNWSQSYRFQEDHLNEAIKYLTNQTQIREIILSGGDPFLLRPQFLDQILKRILSIPQIEVVRIGSRILTFAPQKISPFIKILKKYQPLWLMTHFNHPNEFTKDTEDAIDNLITAGVVLCNQSVLLKGINDDFSTMKKLLHKLEQMRIKPYYLFQCDLVSGTFHFHTKVIQGLAIIKELYEQTGGLCIPQYVIDHPEAGKIPLLPQFCTKTDDHTLEITNYKNEKFIYPLTVS